MADKEKESFRVGKILQEENITQNTESTADPSDHEDLHQLPPQPEFGQKHDTRLAAAPANDPGIQSEEKRPALDPDKAPTYIMPQEGEDDRQIDFLRYMAVILRRRVLIVAMGLAAFLFSMFNVLQKPNIYEAKTRILYKPGRTNDVLEKMSNYELYMDRENQINTFLQLIVSPEILNRVQQNLSVAVSPSVLAGMLSVSRIEKTNIIEVFSKGQDPQFATDLANELVQSFIDYNVEVNTEDINRTIKKLEIQIKKTKVDLEKKENILKKFQEKNKFVEANEETKLEVKKLSEMELSLQNTLIFIQETKKRIDKVQEELKKQKVDIRLENELTQLELELATSRSQYGEEHYKTISTKKKISSLKTLINEQKLKQGQVYTDDPIRLSLMQSMTQLRTDFVAAENKRLGLLDAIDRITMTMQKLPAKELDQMRLMRDKQSVENVYKLLKQKYEEAKIHRDSQGTSLVQLEKAQVPMRPVKSRKMFPIMVGLFLGLGAGIGIAFLLEYMDQTIKTPQDAERVLQLPMLGTIPQTDSEKNILLEGVEKADLLEPYRQLRTNLQYSIPGTGPRIFMLTSAMQAEGKSSKSSRLAISFALNGKRTLLIDADLRRSSQHKIFQVERDRGLAEYLTGQLPFEKVCKKTVFPDLGLVTSGAKPPNPSEIIGSNAMNVFLEEAKKVYDVIIIDTPAALPVTDATVLAPKVDGIIFVVRVLQTPTKAVAQIKNNFTRIGCKMVGVVLNCIPHGKGYYYYRYYHYPYYGYHYSYSSYDETSVAPAVGWRRVEYSLDKIRNFLDLIFKEEGFRKKTRVFIQAFKEHKTIRVLFLGILLLFSLITGVVVLKTAGAENPSDSIYPARTRGAAGGSDAIAVDRDLLVHDISELFQEWKTAYDQRDLERYLAFYSRRNLMTAVGGYQRWAEYQKKRFVKFPAADIHTGELVFSLLSPKKITVEFDIEIVYSSNKRIKTRFLQEWQNQSGLWTIQKERILKNG